MHTVTWTADKHPSYIVLNGNRNMCVRVKPVTDWSGKPTGKHLYQFGEHYAYAASIEEAKELVEGLFVAHGAPNGAEARLSK